MTGGTPGRPAEWPDARGATETAMSQPDHRSREALAVSAQQQYEERLLRYATRLTGDAELARDIVQETFARLCGESAKLNGDLLPWLYTVSRNLAMDARRRTQRMTVVGDFSVRGGIKTVVSATYSKP